MFIAYQFNYPYSHQTGIAYNYDK